MRVLVVEDNADLATGLRNNFEIEGYEVAVAADGPEGVARFLKQPPDLVLLDLMLPGMDGYRVLREIRRARADVPVLVLTARADEADKVRLLKLGADDYVTKPFGVLELLARVRAVLRRTRNGAAHHHPEDGHRFGDIEVDCRARTVT
jgi:DNA-binding response OmpR family regulator